MTLTTYVVGTSVYFLLSVICSATLVTVALSAASEEKELAGASFTMFAAANNLSITVVKTLESRSLVWGTRVIFVVDAILTILAIVTLLLVRQFSNGKWSAGMSPQASEN